MPRSPGSGRPRPAAPSSSTWGRCRSTASWTTCHGRRSLLRARVGGGDHNGHRRYGGRQKQLGRMTPELHRRSAVTEIPVPNPSMLKLGGVALAGYVLGRFKKGRAAVGLAMWAAGVKADPKALLRQGLMSLASSEEGKELLSQLRGPMLEAGRKVAGATIEGQVSALTSALQKRTELRSAGPVDKATGSAKKTTGLLRKHHEEEDEESAAEGAADEGAAESDEYEEEPDIGEEEEEPEEGGEEEEEEEEQPAEDEDRAEDTGEEEEEPA